MRAISLLLVALAAGVVVLSTRSNAQDGPRTSGIYKDPDKLVPSYLLSEPENVEEFRREFGLSDARVEEVLARTRSENRTLAGVYAEGEGILERSRGLSLARKRERISASGYSGKVRRAVGGTKRSVEGTLPKGRRAGLEEQWRDEVREANASERPAPGIPAPPPGRRARTVSSRRSRSATRPSRSRCPAAS